MTVVTFALFVGAYIYCLFHDREALRSETYSIQKLAIEKGFLGDSVTGMFEVDEDASGKLIDPPPTLTALGEKK